jgi:hypothetical protein
MVDFQDWRPYRSPMRTPIAIRITSIGIGLLIVLGVTTPASAAHGGLTPSQLKALTNKVNQAKKLTFEAVYKSVGLGNSASVTIAQAPPKSIFSAAGGVVVDTGTKTYYCSKSGAVDECLSAGSTNPFLGIEQLFSPTAALAAFSTAQEGLVSRSLGIKLSESSASFAGQASTCVTVSVKGKSTKYCVTKQGVLAYSGSGSQYFELTKLVKSPPASLFQLPAGATTVTLP